MTLLIQAMMPPLHTEPSGAVRVGDSRVLLELVVRAFQNGATPETIVQRYDTLDLSDVYDVIAYYLRHQTEVQSYLAQREQLASEVRNQVEARQGNLGQIRARLLARQTV